MWQRSEESFYICDCASRKDTLGKLDAESSVSLSGHCLELIYYPNLPRLKRILVGLHAEPQGLALGFVFGTLHSPSVPLLMYEVLKYLDLRVHFKSRGPPAWGPSVENRRFRYHCSLVLGDTAYPNVLCMENEMIMLGANSFHA